MPADHPPPSTFGGAPAASPREHLERGGVLVYRSCPFSLPGADDRSFLLGQRLGRGHKNVSYDPATGKVAGFRRQSDARGERLRVLLATFSRAATAWLAATMPGYARAWRLDQVSFRPEEEATRKLRQTARNDLLHVDAFQSRPTHGHRILRLFVNVNPSEPRVWVTSEPFARLLERFGAQAGLPAPGDVGPVAWLHHGLLRLFRPGRPRPSAYDRFMLRFHNYLKANEDFQERTPKRLWTFPPGTCWLAFTDVCSHAVLRGRYALEHSYFVAPEGLALPEESPPALLERACGMPVLGRAA